MVDMIGAHTKTNTWIQPGLLRRFFGSLHPRRFANSNFKRTWGRCKESWGKWKMSPATSLRHKSLYTDHSRWSCWKQGIFVLSSGVLVQHSQGSMRRVQDFINSIFLLLVLFPHTLSKQLFLITLHSVCSRLLYLMIHTYTSYLTQPPPPP